MVDRTVALAVGLTFGILGFVILCLCLLWCCCGGDSYGEALKDDEEKGASEDTEVHPDSGELEPNEPSEQPVQEPVQQSVPEVDEEVPPERQIMTTLDVHTCASTTCNVCRKLQTPTFISATRLPTGMEGRIRSLPDRWWEKNYDSETLATMMIMDNQPNSSRSKRSRSERPKRHQDIVKEHPDDES